MKIKIIPGYGIREPRKHQARLQIFILPTPVIGIYKSIHFGFIFLSIFFLNYFVSLKIRWTDIIVAAPASEVRED